MPEMKTLEIAGVVYDIRDASAAPTVHNHSGQHIEPAEFTICPSHSWASAVLKNRNTGEYQGRLQYNDNDKSLFLSIENTQNGANEYYTLPAHSATETAWYNILTTKNPVAIYQGGTGATDAATARANLGAATVEQGESIPENADLNDYTTAGTYHSRSSTISATLKNAPYTGTGFRLDVIKTLSSEHLMQEVKTNSSTSRTYCRTRTNGEWNAWHRVMQSTEDALAIANGGTGATNEAGARAKLGVYSTAEVQNLVNNGKTKVVKLWQNASSIMTSMEGDQYIDLGEGATFDAYDCLVVLCWFSTGFGYIASSPLIFGSLGGHVDFPKGYCGYHASRWFRRDGGNNGRYMHVGHGFKDNVQDNNYCIPQSVYGIKW